MNNYDVLVIGAGPGGYVSAIRFAQLGFKTAIIEKRKTLGGTCANVGCIPSKALLDSSEHFYNLTHKFEEHGIHVGNFSCDLNKMNDRKNQVVDSNTKGIEYLMGKNKITVIKGTATFKTTTVISILKEDNTTEDIEAKNIIIATGSEAANLPFITLDYEKIITSTEALSLNEIPKHLIIVGGGAIGIELGSVYLRLGSQVTVIEYADAIIPNMDRSLSKELQRVLKKQGMKFYTSTQVKEVKREGDFVNLKATDNNNQDIIIQGDYCLIAVGRKPNTENLGIENIGLKIDEKGRIDVNKHLQTNFSNIYAIGDVIKGPMLAHKAEDEAMYVAEFIAGQKPHIDYNLIPGVVYTWPEVASVGKTEEELKNENTMYKVGQFSMRALGRSRASGDTDGFVKVLADKNTDEVLGVHIIAARAADLITEMVVAMEYKASAEDMSRICYAHPTYSEGIKEAMLDASEKRSIHS